MSLLTHVPAGRQVTYSHGDDSGFCRINRYPNRRQAWNWRSKYYSTRHSSYSNGKTEKECKDRCLREAECWAYQVNNCPRDKSVVLDGDTCDNRCYLFKTQYSSTVSTTFPRWPVTVIKWNANDFHGSDSYYRCYERLDNNVTFKTMLPGYYEYDTSYTFRVKAGNFDSEGHGFDPSDGAWRCARRDCLCACVHSLSCFSTRPQVGAMR